MSSQVQAPSAKYKWVNHKQTATSIYLKWDKPAMHESFVIKYRKENGKRFTTEETNDNEITLYNLASDKVYIIKVFIVNDDEDIIKLFETVCRTNPSPSIKILQESTLIHGCNKPYIYKLPCIVQESEMDYFKLFHIFSKQPYDAKEKTILVIGTGKRTFINAMINYIADVSFDDEFRFEMVEPTNIDKRNKDLSQLSTAITCYRIPLRKEFNIGFPLNIIDTPGINVFRAKPADERIPSQIKHVLESVFHIVHSVCLIVPLCTTRLSDVQQMTYSSILGLFDADMKKNIHPCLTYDDGGPATVLSTLEAAGIPFDKYFRFNNAGLFQIGREERNGIDRKIWCDRRKHFKDLFSEIWKVSP